MELLFAKNVFGATDLKVSAKTVIEKRDTGEWTNLEELKTYVEYSFEALKSRTTFIEMPLSVDFKEEEKIYTIKKPFFKNAAIFFTTINFLKE